LAIGVFGDEAGAHEHVGVGCIGAGGDGGNDDIAVTDFHRLAVEFHVELALGHRVAAFGAHGFASGFIVKFGDVLDFGIPVVVTAEDVGKGFLEIGQGDAVLGARRAGQRGFDRRQIQLHHLGELRVRFAGVEHARGLGIGLNDPCAVASAGQSR
jgi:hypothetical protein